MKTWLCHPKGQMWLKRENPLKNIFTEVNALMIICMKYGEQLGRDCVRPRGSYGPKGVIPCIFLMTIVNT